MSEGKATRDLGDVLLGLVPPDGSAIGNKALREVFLKRTRDLDIAIDAPAFEQVRQDLIARGILVRSKGRGGSVKRADTDTSGFGLEARNPPTRKTAGKTAKPAKKAAAKRRKPAAGEPDVLSYRHMDKRRNNPPVGLVNAGSDPDSGKDRWCYDPHIDPALQFDFGRAQVEKLIDDALASGDSDSMRAALEELKRYSAPYLNWTGKAERTAFEPDTVSLHVHERMDPASILAAVRKRAKDPKAASWRQGDLFAAPFENLPLRDAIDFYRHERGWSNRLIAGDSLLVMNSLLQKEGMAGQVQMIYIDPPYGIRYGSNFQPFVNRREVKDRKDEDLTQEPEMVKAFRDTWELGIHSYLTYLRDRLLLARELLSESGSLFVQISDENLHLVRNLCDELFGKSNFVSVVTFVKTSGQTSELLSGVSDYLVWYSKDRAQLKFRQPFATKSVGGEGSGEYIWSRQKNGEERTLTSKERRDPSLITGNVSVFRHDSMTSQGFRQFTTVDFFFQGRKHHPGQNSNWKTTVAGLRRLGAADRLISSGTILKYKRFLDDFPVLPIGNNWRDTATGGSSSDPRAYVVQTVTRVIERCVLMTTDPGDLVLDPTCGSGTTAFVAEKWGRRWITCDTSRVATTLAKQRLLTASYDYYALRYPHEGLKTGFVYKTVPHVTLKSIANNPDIDEIHERLHPLMEQALEALNATLQKRFPFLRAGGDRPAGRTPFEEWEVPFDFADLVSLLEQKGGEKAVTRIEYEGDELRDLLTGFHDARLSLQRQIDASIAAHAPQETLYDKPEIEKSKLRIPGPFTVEAVPFPSVLSLDEAEQPREADAAIARSGESARQHQWRDELLKTGIRGKGGQMLRFSELETLSGTQHLQVSGTIAEPDDGEDEGGLGGHRVVVSFGPEHAALEQRQVELALREAGELFPLPRLIVFCAFLFDPEAAKDIDAIKGIAALKVQMNTDLLTEDLKKARSSNQSFWLMGQPDVELRTREDGTYEVEVMGFDYFDTRNGELVSGGKGKIAMWLLDTDYDDRSLYPRQVFFPMAGSKDGWYRLRKAIRAELDDGLLEGYQGTMSLPFEAGDNRKIAVKIIDDRGIESLKVIALD